MNEEELGKQMLKFELDQVKLGLRSRDRGNQFPSNVERELTPNQKIILKCLDEVGETTCYEIAQKTGIKMGSVIAHMANMSELNLIEKVREVPTPYRSKREDLTIKVQRQRKVWLWKGKIAC